MSGWYAGGNIDRMTVRPGPTGRCRGWLSYKRVAATLMAITCTDKDSYQTPQRQPTPIVTVLRDTQHPSHVVLPIVN